MSQYQMTRSEALALPLVLGFALLRRAAHRLSGEETPGGYIDRAVIRARRRKREELEMLYNLV